MTHLTVMAVALEAVSYVNLTDEVQRTGLSVSEHLLGTAKDYFNANDAIDKDGKPQGYINWLAACLEAEKMAKSPSSQIFRDSNNKEYTGGGLDKMPACWTQAKSNIKKAWDKGLNLANFKTESGLRKALNDERKGTETPEAKEAFKKELAKASNHAKDVKIETLPQDVQGLLAAFVLQAQELFIGLPKKTINEEQLKLVQGAQAKFLEKLKADYTSTKNQLEKVRKAVMPMAPVAKKEPTEELSEVKTA